MAYETDTKSAAELQRETELQRTRVESTIDEIQQKLSPGQLVDELLAYTKGGSGEFMSSLQKNITSNPLPVALLGVSLAWLMAKPTDAASAGRSGADRSWENSINTDRGYHPDRGASNYPVKTISGSSLQRLRQGRDQTGFNYSEFADDEGKTFKALMDETGKRAGHFVDETGSSFRGFTDAAGKQIDEFRDETGNLIDQATGWASHSWELAREKLHDARDAATSGQDSLGHQATDAAEALRGQAANLNRTLLNQFKDQPLVAGALAFALGAALGSALPHTPQEDALLGDAADAVKGQALDQASELYDQGKGKGADLYETATGKAGEFYKQAKTGLADAVSDRPKTQGV